MLLSNNSDHYSNTTSHPLPNSEMRTSDVLCHMHCQCEGVFCPQRLSLVAKLIVSRDHTPFRNGEGRGLVTSFTAVCCAALYSAGQSQRCILSHECCYHNFDRKLQGVNQLGNHKQLLCQSSQTNYAALALAQCE